MGARAKDLSGCKFGRLTVQKRAEDKISASGYRTVMWDCKCECGNNVTVRGKCLTQGITRSCGCLAKDLMLDRSWKHHGYGTRLYNIWNSMRQRCNNPKNRAYHNYGGRGIKICQEWNDFNLFRKWALDNGYNETANRGICTLDRKNVNDNYSPNNCRWVDMKEQSNNKRNTIFLSLNGESHPLTEWAKITNIKYDTLWHRYKYGWDAKRILTK